MRILLQNEDGTWARKPLFVSGDAYWLLACLAYGLAVIAASVAGLARGEG